MRVIATDNELSPRGQQLAREQHARRPGDLNRDNGAVSRFYFSFPKTV